MGTGILFDFGGTLDADGVPWARQFFEHYRAVGGQVVETDFTTAFQASDRTLYAGGILPSDGYTATVAKQLLALRELLPDGRLVDAEAWAADLVAETKETIGRNRPVLEALAEQHRLGVVSNFFGNLRAVMAELGILSLFKTVTDSTEAGLWKPDERVFRLTCSRLQLLPDECWMVGDNPFADIVPATALSMSTCWLAPADRPTPADVLPTRRIASLGELVEVLA